ncbi:MAG: 3-phosphoserine/phosphohydroxythreonine transaminase [Proteobacteria bacterium]|nr:3-phosphoserine/phosphohydroxythreonine transaminase [Pseudomonadota bacterium]
MNRVYNFSPGPSMLPDAVLEKARDSLLNWNNTGMSVMEISHRGKDFAAVAQSFEGRLRRLLAIPENYRVLYLSGGATGQFAAVALNLGRPGKHAEYLISGQWGKKAVAEAAQFTDVRTVADTFAQLRAPVAEDINLSGEASYVHYTHNETIIGVEYQTVPETGAVPLVGDFSSTLLSRPVPISRYGAIYACTQKNIGAAGTAVVIVREDLIKDKPKAVPSIFDWTVQDGQQSMYNTPATFNWYLSELVLEWIEDQGGLEVMAEHNQAKASALYDYIDDSQWYRNPIDKQSRSWMNVPFTLPDDSLDARFLGEAEQAGLANLKGHRSIGGMRASIYNSMPMAGVQALIDFMRDFAQRNG